MPFCDTYANNILGWAFGKNNLTASHSKVYIGLSTNNPEETNGSFNELSGGGYHRVLIGLYNETYPDVIGKPVNRKINNLKQINWTKATADWATANGFGLFTAETGGTPYFYGKLKNPVSVESGMVALFDPESLEISFPATDIEVEAVAE